MFITNPVEIVDYLRLNNIQILFRLKFTNLYKDSHGFIGVQGLLKLLPSSALKIPPSCQPKHQRTSSSALQSPSTGDC